MNESNGILYRTNAEERIRWETGGSVESRTVATWCEDRQGKKEMSQPRELFFSEVRFQKEYFLCFNFQFLK